MANKPTKVMMPKLGESVVEGTVARWLKREGEAVEEYESLLVVSTDKVDAEIPAPATGIVEAIYVQEGETVEQGTLLALIGEAVVETVVKGDPVHAAKATKEQLHQAFENPHSRPDLPHRAVKAELVDVGLNGAHSIESDANHMTPVVARMVAEHNLNVTQITGTGRGGRITKKDVEAYLEAHGIAPAESELAPWEQPGKGELFSPREGFAAAKPAPKPMKPQTPIASDTNGIPGELVQINRMRQVIAEHMVRSAHTSPHVTTVFEVDMSAVMAHREANKVAFAKQSIKLTLTAYFVAATVTALRGTPTLNAQWRDDGIWLHHIMNIGVAVALPDGLIVPVIKNAQDLSLSGIARALEDLSSRARANQLKPDDAQGGTFTITNHGVSGSLFATPIINQPQAGILGIGVVEKRVKVINDMIAIRPCAYLSLTFDHRIADGTTGDACLSAVKRTLENWT
ncbi:MAG: 2-oxo acid dehydrogenase subunit E2 [Burkholderiales bacterium]|nr:2-oxo acid dehydrogenase subunit E2 [Anaerolineae bacterium]